MNQPLSFPHSSAHGDARLHHMFIDEITLLVWAKNPLFAGADISARTDGGDLCAIQAYSFALDGETYVCAIIRHPSFVQGQSCTVTLMAADEVCAIHDGALSGDDTSERLLYLFSQLNAENQQLFFSFLTGQVANAFALSHAARFRALCIHLLNSLDSAHFKVTESYWLTPTILYLEGVADHVRPYGEPRILMLSEQIFGNAISRFIQLSEHGFAFIVVFDNEDSVPLIQQTSLTYFSENHLVRFENVAPRIAYGLEFTQYLCTRPPYQRYGLRGLICQALIDFTADHRRAQTKELIHKLQLYVDMPVQHCTNAADPFNMHFERVIPLENDGVFVNGWMRDPYHLLESIEVHSPLGFSFPMGEHLFRTKRPDVQEAFRNSPHGGFDEDMGFVAYAPLPPEIRARLQGVAQLHAFSFTVRLKSGISYEIQPEMHYLDARAARDIVLKLVHTNEASEDMLLRCLGPAAVTLQRLCMEQVKVKDVYEMGEQVKNPRVSLSIPLYKRLDFMKVQFATMANDPGMKQCEIIYVLDSPWQEAEVKDFLREYSHLYQLPVKLVVMQHNSGYAAASNTGTMVARGEYIVLLNSDVFPITPNWAINMADFYASTPNIGALAPKLIYEDESLQHAGMFFAKTTFPDWINLHYYKGYSRNYAPASVSRPVPAVTGACLMMKRDLWEEIGRLSVDYVVGDFEDSDLCLKCSARGLENWYYADAELYHLERQSVPLNTSYTDSLAWRYNARQHTTRWNDIIISLMNTYAAV
jgi:GT2 family glycosyltransferase